MALKNLTDITLNSVEYCYLIGTHKYYNKNFKVRLPKLSPLVSGYQPKTSKAIFNSKIFVNSNKCKPTVSKSLKKQNYITIRRSENCNLSHLADIHDNIYGGTQLVSSCINNNPRDVTLMDG